MAEIIKTIDNAATKDVFDLRISDKAELRVMAEKLAAMLTDANLDKTVNPVVEITDENGKTAEKLIRDAMEFIVGKYTNISRDECFKALKETDDPMLEAVKQLTYPSIKIVDVQGKKDGSELAKTIIDDTEKPIDLFKLHKYVGGDGIGANKQWPYMVEKFNMLMTAQKAVDLGINPKKINNSYAMSEISDGIDLGKTPTSKTNILKTLQSIITAMIGEEYKATSHDVNYLLSIYSRKSRKALTVSCANHRYMRQYLMEICHRIALGKVYDVEFKMKKQ